MSDEEIMVLVRSIADKDKVDPFNSQGDMATLTVHELHSFARLISARQREIDKEICSNAGRTAYRQQARRMAFELAEKIGSQK